LNLGGLFDATTNDAQLIFEYAVKQVNNAIGGKSGGKLEAMAVNVSYGDEFEVSQKLCKLLKVCPIFESFFY
jgi:ionotropic glutamate receptor